MVFTKTTIECGSQRYASEAAPVDPQTVKITQSTDLYESINRLFAKTRSLQKVPSKKPVDSVSERPVADRKIEGILHASVAKASVERQAEIPDHPMQKNLKIRGCLLESYENTIGPLLIHASCYY